MTLETPQERKNKRVAMATSIGIHALVVLILLFAVAWRAPDPPLPEYGIQLNFGVDNEGSGDIQPETPPSSSAEVKAQPEEQNQQPQEEVKQEQTTTAKDEPNPEQEIVPVQSDLESPVETKEEKKPVQKQNVQETREKPVVKQEPKKESLPAAVYTKKTESDGTVSQGDDVNKAGDKGDEHGQLDANALYRKPGGGQGGSSLDMANWNWDEIPHPNVPDNEMGGRIVFEIQVDANGELRGYKKIEGAVGPETEKACRAAIEKLTFSKKPGAVVPAMSTGRITFVITSK